VHDIRRLIVISLLLHCEWLEDSDFGFDVAQGSVSLEPLMAAACMGILFHLCVAYTFVDIFECCRRVIGRRRGAL
jgi:hypothetical protein